MASKYLQKFPVPGSFPDMLHDFAREVLRDQPENIYEYGANYFRCMEQGVEFNPNQMGEYQEGSPRQEGEDETARDALFWENSVEVVAKMGFGTKMPDYFNALAESGRLGFGDPPEDFEDNERAFATWFNTDMGAYQGEVDAEGNPDGRGINIVERGNIKIGYWKHGMQHGQFIEIFWDGDMFEGPYVSDKRHGQFVYTKADGTQVVQMKDMGRTV